MGFAEKRACVVGRSVFTWFAIALATGMMAGASVSFAQGNDSAQQTAADGNTAGQSASRAETAKGVETLIVTATRRAEDKQSIPIPISAFSGGMLERRQINNLEDLSSLVPGLTLNLSGGGSQINPSMRGSFVAEDSPGVEMPIAVFVDGIYQGSAVSMFADLYDVGSVEVLRGPQGTTFGRNATSGVIRIINNRPAFDDTSGQISITGVNLPGIKAEGYFNHSFSSKVAARLSFITTRYGGHTRNLETGTRLGQIDRWSVRGQLAFKLNDRLDILISGTYARERSVGAVRKGLCSLIEPDPSPFTCTELDTYEPGLSPTLDTVEISEDGFTNRNIWYAFMEANWDLGFATLTLVTAGRGLNLDAHLAIAGTPLPIFPLIDPRLPKDQNTEKQFSQEVRLVSPSGQRFEWIVGLYYLDQRLFRQENNFFRPDPGLFVALLQGPFDTPTLQEINVQSIAPYAEVTYNVTGWFSAFAGIRYTYDKKTGFNEHAGDPNRFLGENYFAALDGNWDGWTPRFGIEITPQEDILLFATVSRGFKSGGFSNNAGTAAQARAGFDQEFVWNYEIGAKTSWFDNRLIFNVNAYIANIRDLQARVFNDVLGFVFSNAGRARTKGFEIELVAIPVEGLQFEVTYGYLDAKFKEFFGCLNNQPMSNCGGNRMPQSPKHTLFAAMQYSTPVSSLAGQLTFRAEFEHRSETFFTATNTRLAAYKISDITQVNLSLNYDSDDGLWQVSVWGRNIFDQSRIASAVDFTVFFVSPAEFGTKSVDLTVPTGHASFGLTVRRAF